MKGCRQHAFTLLEVVLVLVIAAAAYALVIRLGSNGVSGAELKGAARSLAAGLREARGQAIARQEASTLTIDVENRSFEVAGTGRARPLPSGLELKLYTAQSEIVDQSRGGIRFNPDGSSTGGRITVASKRASLLVDVDWLTGRVKISDGEPPGGRR